MLNLPHEPIPSPPTGKFILITPTTGDGEVPQPINDYMAQHRTDCIGVIAGGNRNFGASFAGAGKRIAAQYGIPFLYAFELAGTDRDVDICRRGIMRIFNE